MFRFSVDRETARRANEKKLASNHVTRDEDWEVGLRDTEGLGEDEQCYRAENANPRSPEEAVSYVRAQVDAAPTRVWIGEDVYEVTEELTERAQ